MKTIIQIKSAVILFAVFFSAIQSVSAQVPVRPGLITGQRHGVCGLAFAYSIAPVAGATGYTWTASAGTIAAGQNTTSIIVTFPVASATVFIGVTANNSFGSSPVRSIGVHGKPPFPGTIVSIPSDWCAGTNGVQFFSDVTSMVGFYSLQWSWNPVPAAGNATGVNSNLLSLDWYSQTNNAVVRLAATNSCGTSIKYYTTTVTCGQDGNQDRVMDEVVTMQPESNSMVFPNPNDGNFILSFNSTDESVYSIKIIDIAGRIVFDDEVKAVTGENNYEVDLSQSAKGVYSVLINGAGVNEVKRISVQ